MDIIESFKKELLRRRYSLQTIKSYSFCIKQFLKFCHKEPRKFTKSDVKNYLNKLSGKGRSGSTMNVNLQALKFMMENILNKRRYFYNIKYSKTPRKFPTVLNKDEVIGLINAIENDKHKLMIKLIYSAGLRVSELLNLKIENLDLINNFGYIRSGKGNKDRLFIIADSLKQEVFNYIIKNKLEKDSFLFKSYNGRMSSRTIQEILKKATKNANINKRVHPHALRHSFATHLIENNYSISEVQSLLGHKSPETTMIYVHMISPKFLSVKSPWDDLQLKKNYTKFTYENQNSGFTKPTSEEFRDLRI